MTVIMREVFAKDVTVGDAHFSESESVGTSEVDLWPFSGTSATINWPAAGIQPKLSSDSAADAAAGAGVNSVRVSYLDTNNVALYEDVTLTGTTAVTMTAANVLRVNKVEAIGTPGSNNTNVGNIYLFTGADSGVTPGVPDNANQVFAYVEADHGVSTQSNFTTWAGYQWAIGRVYASSGKGASTVNILFYLRKTSSSPWTVFRHFPVKEGSKDEGDGTMIPVPAGADIRAAAVSATGTNHVAVTYEILGRPRT